MLVFEFVAALAAKLFAGAAITSALWGIRHEWNGWYRADRQDR